LLVIDPIAKVKSVFLKHITDCEVLRASSEANEAVMLSLYTV
jgi:hypothetical protein